MCLNRQLTDKLSIASEDIVCYKVVAVPYDIRHKFKTKLLRLLHLWKHYETYFMDESITIGSTVIAQPVFTERILEHMDKHQTTIEEGFIHSYRKKEDARRFQKSRAYRCDVVKCIIPKGTYYFTGAGNNSNSLEPQYASTQIKYVKVI